jgi:hypothetical protein
MGRTQGPIPPQPKQVLAMFIAKRKIVKEGCGKLLEYLSDDLPVSWAEVGTKWLTA